MNPSESQRNQNNLGEKKAIKTAEIKKTNNRLKTPIISIKLRQRRKKNVVRSRIAPKNPVEFAADIINYLKTALETVETEGGERNRKEKQRRWKTSKIPGKPQRVLHIKSSAQYTNTEQISMKRCWCNFWCSWKREGGRKREKEKERKNPKNRRKNLPVCPPAVPMVSAVLLIIYDCWNLLV